MFSGRFWVLSAVAAVAATLSEGCKKSELVGISKDVYVSRSVPGLQRTAAAVSNAWRKVDASATRTLSVTVVADGVLGPESFRVIVDSESVRVEGGGPGGAVYGALQIAQWSREGREPRDIAEAHPSFPLRIVRVRAEPPIGEPGAKERWTEFLETLAVSRWNTLVLDLRDRLPALVKMERYPRAFDGLPGVSTAAPSAFQGFLRSARELNVSVILLFPKLALPRPFIQRYAARGDADLSSQIGRSYVAECIASLLKSYPDLAGVGLSQGALADLPPAERAGFVLSAIGEGIRASDRKALLFLEAGAAEELRDLELPGEVTVVAETRFVPGCDQVGRSGREPPKRKSTRSCVAIPSREISPVLPGLASAKGALHEIGKAKAPEGILLELPDPCAKHPYPRTRARLIACSYGLSAFHPPLEDPEVLWREAFGERGGELARIAERLGRAWYRLAEFHGSERGWDALTSTESKNSPPALRDAVPFVSLLEFVFSATGSGRVLSIPEFVALEVEGKEADPDRVDPLQIASDLVETSAWVLSALERLGASWKPDDVGAQAARELRAGAQLAAYHGRRIRAGVALLHFASGRDPNGKAAGLEEMRAALESFKDAASHFRSLREAAGSLGDYPPDLSPWTSEAEKDVALLENLRADPGGFHLFVRYSGFGERKTCDYRFAQGFMDLGNDLLRAPAVSCNPSGQHFEWEDFGTGWRRERDLSGFSGEGYITSGAEGALAELPVAVRLSVPRSCRCNFWIRAFSPGRGGDSAVLLRLNGREVGKTHAGTAAIGFTWDRAGIAELLRGDNVLELIDAGSGREYVDALVITEDLDWVPPTF